MSEKFLLLDSRDNNNYGATSSDCMFHLGNGQDFNEVNSVELLSFNCPLTMYNVNSSNNTIYFNDGSARSVVLPPSNYDVYALIAAIKVAMESVSALTFTVTYSDQTLKITVTGSLAFSFTFGTNTSYSASKIIGFNNANTSSSVTQTGNNAINLSIPLYIMIKVDGFSSSIKSSNPYDNATFVVSTVGNNSDILTWTPGSFYQQRVLSFNDNVSDLRVVLRDYNNTQIDLNGGHWSMLLRLIY